MNKIIVPAVSIIMITLFLFVPMVLQYPETEKIGIGDKFGPFTVIGIDFTGAGSYVNPQIYHITVNNGVETFSFSFDRDSFYTSTFWGFTFTIYHVTNDSILWMAEGEDKSQMVSIISILFPMDIIVGEAKK